MTIIKKIILIFVRKMIGVYFVLYKNYGTNPRRVE